MTAVARSFSRLTLAGKVLFTVVPILAILTGGLIVLVVVAGKPVVDFLATNLWLVRFVVAATAVLLMSIPTAFLVGYMELKLIALMNLRIGPDRVGPFGSLISIAHGLKMLAKEDFSPTGADRLVFTLAPVAAFMATVMSLLVIPFAPGLFGADMNIGLLYFFAVGGLTVIGLLMAGWSSFNKYSLIGGLRSAAQIISYEIPLTLSVVGLLLLAGTMSLNHLVELQGPYKDAAGVVHGGGWFTDWFVFRQPLGALIFFIAATAEANRTPFDLTEADSEIVAGFATEYSGMRFGFFYFAEFVNVFVISALIVVLFFGGWNAPFPWPWPITLNIDPGSMGLGLLFALLIVPPLLILALAAPFYVGRSSLPWWQALIIGFLLFNLLVVLAVGGWAFISWDWVGGLLWFLLKSYVFVSIFVWMRGTLPRVRIDQLMGFAWKWLLPASLLNLFVTAAALVITDLLRNPR